LDLRCNWVPDEDAEWWAEGASNEYEECQSKENIMKIMIRDRANPRVAGYNQREKQKRISINK